MKKYEGPEQVELKVVVQIETVFSGAGRISKKSRKLSPTLLSDYAFCHYNYKYDWLRPTEKEIIEAYNKLYRNKGKRNQPQTRRERRAAASDSSAEESSEKEEEEGEDGEDGEDAV